jgi:hypothetical protein
MKKFRRWLVKMPTKELEKLATLVAITSISLWLIMLVFFFGH